VGRALERDQEKNSAVEAAALAGDKKARKERRTISSSTKAG
jgi:hypothetical protein